jgi:hypothetical protein
MEDPPIKWRMPGKRILGILKAAIGILGGILQLVYFIHKLLSEW